MTLGMQPIYTQTVNASSVGSIAFTNIPQTFTDLKIVLSLRDAYAGGFDSVLMQFNSDTTNNYSYTVMGGAPSSYRATSQNLINPFLANGTTSTASTFTNMEAYIPNYTSSNKKSMVIDVIGENNSASVFGLSMTAALWSNTAAITSVYFQASNGNITQYSTISLYGITKG
jgi:hypothetical protein